MTRTIAAMMLAGAALAACGKGSSGPGQDWSGKPLDVKIADEIHGAKFTLQAPAGMKLADTSDVTKEWRADVDDYFSEPSFTVAYEAIPAKTIDDYVRDAMLDKNDVVVKKEATADGFVLLYRTKTWGIVRAHVMKQKGDVHLECRASQAKQGGVPSHDQTLAWLERLCSSLAIQ